MLFSFKQFQETKHALINQFERQPALEVKEQDNSSTVHQYNKLLNQIKFAKKTRSNTNRIQLQSAKIKRNQRFFIKSATYRGLSKENYEICSKEIQALKDENRNKGQSTQHKKNQLMTLLQTANQFYITELNDGVTLKQNQDSQKIIKKMSILQPSQFSQKQQHIQVQQTFDDDLQELMNLRVKIFEFQDQEKYLHGEISDLQQSVRFIKKLNNQLQQKVQQKEKKNLIELNFMLKKQSDLNTVDSRNKYFKQKFQVTQKFFAKSLKSIKISRNSQSKKCTQMIEDVTQKILTLKYLNKRIQQQKIQMAKIQQKNHYKVSIIQQSKKKGKYEQVLIKLGHVTKFIKENSYGKVKILRQIEKELQQGRRRPIEKSRLNQSNIRNSRYNSRGEKYQTPIKKQRRYQSQFQDTNFLELTKQILTIYLKLTKDQIRLKQTYQQKINQLENHRIIFYQFNKKGQSQVKKVNQWKSRSKILELSVFCKQFKQKIKIFDQECSRQQNKKIINNKLFRINTITIDPTLIEQTLKKQQQKIKKINESLLSMQDRLKFFVKKQIKLLEGIMERWLKFDKSAINFLQQIINKYVKIQYRNKQQLSHDQSKLIIRQHFQNWSNYIFFIQQLHNNPLTSSFLTKSKIKQMFKRIIKTKISNQNVLTQTILLKFLKLFYKQSIGNIIDNIRMFIRLGLDIYSYSNKYQVLIVNSSSINGFAPEIKEQITLNPNIQATNQLNPLLKLLATLLFDKSSQNNQIKAQISSTNLISYKKHLQNTLKQQKRTKKIWLQVDSSDEEHVTKKQLQQKQKQKQKCQQNHLTLVSMILAYQLQLNKIIKIRPSANLTFS